MVDYLIIGHGLAGAVLSHELLKAGKSVRVYNAPSSRAASLVAGGLYNPITGRKMLKTWKADLLFEEIEPYYREMEEKLGASFLHPLGIYRPFFSIEEQNEWQGKWSDAHFSPYIQQVYTKAQHQYPLNDPYGGLLLKKAGYVDTKVLVEANKKYLTDKGIYEEKVFNEDNMQSCGDYLEYEDLRFGRLIYCNGYNPDQHWSFDWLPFKPVKGEILSVSLPHTMDVIANRGVFILPRGREKYRIGSTYNWRTLNFETTQQAQEELEEKIKKIYKGEYTIEGADAGIRPATKDRRPLIGMHPKNNRLGVFNGFGSKGVSLIPYFAKNFVGSLTGEEELDEEVNIYRYFSLP